MRSASGNVSGRLSGDQIHATAKGDSFSAGLSLTTHGNRQSVSITPRETFTIGHVASSVAAPLSAAHYTVSNYQAVAKSGTRDAGITVTIQRNSGWSI